MFDAANISARENPEKGNPKIKIYHTKRYPEIDFKKLRVNNFFPKNLLLTKIAVDDSKDLGSEF